jgi:hypothetical protein
VGERVSCVDMLGVKLICTGMLGWCRTDTSHLISCCSKFVIFVRALEIMYTLWSNISSSSISSEVTVVVLVVVQAAAGIPTAVVTE